MSAREILKEFGDRVGCSESDLEEFRDNDQQVRHMGKMALLPPCTPSKPR